MKSINKLIPIILITSSIVACKTTNSGSNDEFNYDAAYQEVATFFNSSNIDITMKLNVAGTLTSIMSLYSDEEKIIQSTYTNADLKEITTKDKSVLSGNGYKVYIEKDNTAMFNNEQIDFKQYFKTSTFRSGFKTFEFTLDLLEASTKTGLLDSEALDELADELYIDLHNVDFLVEFSAYKISTLSMVFDEYTEGIYGIKVPLRIVYAVSSYGDTLKKRTIDLSSYLKVDQKTYDIVTKDFAFIITYGYGYYFDSKLSYYDYFINTVPEDAIVATFNAPNTEDDIQILFKDTVFDEENGTFTYTFAGKTFTSEIKIVYGDVIKRKDQIAFDKINVTSESNIYYDMGNNRALIHDNGVVTLFNLSTLEIIKQYEIEGALGGALGKIMVHDDVYHITTVTDAPSSGYYNDYDNRGLIYVIDKTSLEVTDIINIDTAPDYTVVDKRGDIIVCPGRGQWCPIYIYHPNTKTTERLCGYESVFYHGSYLAYDKEQDMLVVNDTAISSGVDPEFFIYQDGQYVHDKNRSGKLIDGPSYAVVFSFYNDYFISESNYVVNVKDWEHPSSQKYIDRDLISWDKGFCFPGDGNIYVVMEGWNGNTIIVKINTANGEISTYFTNENYLNYSFGFVKDGLVNLYDSDNKSLVRFEIK